MADDTVSIRIRLSGGREVEGELKDVQKEIKDVGTATKKTAAQSALAGRGVGKWSGRLRGAWSGIKKVARVAAIGLAGAAVAVAAWGRKAISNTASLAKATSGLHENLGLSVEKSSLLLNLAKVRGADATKFGMSMKSLSSQVHAAATGSETAMGAFRKLGISQKETEQGSRNFGALLGDVAEGFEHTEKGTTRLALASKLFGKGYATIFPLFRDGRKALQENLDTARGFGAYLTGKGKDSMMDFVEAQRESELANIGMEIAFSENVTPALIEVFQWFGKTMKEFRRGKGPLAGITSALQPFAEGLLKIAKLLVENPILLKAVIAAVIAYKVATMAATVAQIAAAATNPWVLIALAVIALGVAFFIAYKKIKWFRNGVDAVFKFVKKNWQVLLIPIAPIVVVWITIYKVIKANIGRIKAVVFTVKDAVVNAFNAVVGFFKSLPGKIAGALSGLGRKIAAPFIWAWEKVKAIWEKIQGIKDKITGAIPGIHLPSPGDVIGALPGFQVGVHNFRGGLSVVGEGGPELVSLPRGSDVIPHRAAKQVMMNTARFSRARREVRQPIKLALDGRVLAETVVTIQDDAEARE